MSHRAHNNPDSSSIEDLTEKRETNLDREDSSLVGSKYYEGKGKWDGEKNSTEYTRYLVEAHSHIGLVEDCVPRCSEHI